MMAANYYLLMSSGEIENIPLEADTAINELATNAALGYPHDTESDPYMDCCPIGDSEVIIISHSVNRGEAAPPPLPPTPCTIRGARGGPLGPPLVNELPTFKGSWHPTEINAALRKYFPDSPIVGNAIVLLTREGDDKLGGDDMAILFNNLEEVLAQITIAPDESGSSSTMPRRGGYNCITPSNQTYAALAAARGFIDSSTLIHDEQPRGALTEILAQLNRVGDEPTSS